MISVYCMASVKHVSATALLVAMAAMLTGCSTSGWMYGTGFNTELIGLSSVEFEKGWQSETDKRRTSNGKPYRVETGQIEDAHYELRFWRVYTQYTGILAHEEWVAFRNGKFAAFGKGNMNAAGVEQFWQSLHDFGRIDVEELDSIKAKAIEQSETDPICGLVRGPGYGPGGLVAIVIAPESSPWRYQGVILEHRLSRVVGEIDFYLSPTGGGQYEGTLRWWNTQGHPFEISKCDLALTTHATAQLTSTVLGQSQAMLLRLMSHEGHSDHNENDPDTTSEAIGRIESKR